MIWVALAIAGTQRPPPLPLLPGCELWVGTSSGNDPTQLIELRLCGDRGSVQSSSLNSGYSIREVDGHWEGDTVILRDVRFEVNRPGEGWRFCLCEVYRLTRSGDHLDGTYDSTACDDHATLNLVRQDRPVAPILARPPAPLTPAFEPPSSACGCDTPMRMSGWALLAAVGLIARRPRSTPPLREILARVRHLAAVGIVRPRL